MHDVWEDILRSILQLFDCQARKRSPNLWVAALRIWIAALDAGAACTAVARCSMPLPQYSRASTPRRYK